MKNQKKGGAKRSVGEKVADALELPKDILLNMPKMAIFGNKEITVENYKGILEYTENKVRLNTASYVLVINGENLSIKNIATEIITVYGKFSNIEFT